jgi:AAA+ ATPase superfamily predicted ATPase
VDRRFIDRERELTFLDKKWQEPEAQFIILWGKRRVGKTGAGGQVYFLNISFFLLNP